LGQPQAGHQFPQARSVVKSVKITTKVTLKLSKREFYWFIIIIALALPYLVKLVLA
jgi:hypothetical protein